MDELVDLFAVTVYAAEPATSDVVRLTAPPAIPPGRARREISNYLRLYRWRRGIDAEILH